MRRREFLLASALGAIAPASAFAQARPARVGMLSARPLADSFYAGPIVRRLAELGYRDGAGMHLEFRSGDGIAERYPKLARELIEAKCDLIFVIGPEAPVRALQIAGAPVPIVFLAVDYDPLEKGIVSSLSKPDRNTTGAYIPQNALVAKRVEIMREIVPAARRFLVFADVFTLDQMRAARKAADLTGVQLTVVEFSKPPYDLAAGFERGRKDKVEGYIALASAALAARTADMTALLLKYKLPGAGTSRAWAESGFLFSFGPDVGKVTRRVAELGARILKGARPVDIPVEQADEFELVINAKTARALGVKIPESVLARATRIVS